MTVAQIKKLLKEKGWNERTAGCVGYFCKKGQQNVYVRRNIKNGKAGVLYWKKVAPNKMDLRATVAVPKIRQLAG